MECSQNRGFVNGPCVCLEDIQTVTVGPGKVKQTCKLALKAKTSMNNTFL